MSLVQAIDALLAFVDEQPIPVEGDRRDSFDALDGAVYVEACRAGLKGELPERRPDGEYLGQTNLPGFWLIWPHHFTPTGLRAWRGKLQSLRALAVAPPPTEHPACKVEPPAAEKTSNADQLLARLCEVVGDEVTTKVLAMASQKDLSGEQRMAEIIRLDKRFAAKNSVQWGTLLDVTPAAVRGYPSWKRLQAAKKDD